MTGRGILTKVLGMRPVTAIFVPKELNFLQKERRNVAEDLICRGPDLMKRIIIAPCDFFLFPKLKLVLRGRRFASIEEIKQN